MVSWKFGDKCYWRGHKAVVIAKGKDWVDIAYYDPKDEFCWQTVEDISPKAIKWKDDKWCNG